MRAQNARTERVCTGRCNDWEETVDGAAWGYRHGGRHFHDRGGLRCRRHADKGSAEAVSGVRHAEGRHRHDRLSGSATGLHRSELVGNVGRVRDAADVPARGRSGRLQARAGACAVTAEHFCQRQGVQVQAAEGPQVLERQEGAGVRLQVGDQARLPRDRTGRRLLHRHRRREGVLEEPD